MFVFSGISRALPSAVFLTGFLAISAFAQLEWTARNSGQTRTLNAVTWTGTMLAAVGNNGAVSTSPNGVDWTTRTSGATRTLYGVAGRDSLLVAVGEGGVLLRSTDGGVTWESRTVETSRTFYGVLHAGGLFVAVGSRGTLFTSPDGNLWTLGTAGTTTDLTSVAWDGARYVAVGDNGLIRSSLDGVIWSDHTVDTFNDDVDAVIWTGTSFYAMGENGIMLSSPDGQTWTMRDGPGTVLGVAWSGSHLIAVGLSGGAWIQSPGSLWTPNSPTTQALRGVVWTGSRIVTVGGGGVVFTAETTPAPPAAPLPFLPQQPGYPVPILPALPILTWGSSPGALSYRVQISTDPTFSTLLLDTVLTGTSLQTFLHTPGTTYYWRVAGINATGMGAFSEPRAFTTGSSPLLPPLAPALLSPAPFATSVQVPTQLRWNTAASAVHYRVQVSRTPDFSSLAFEDTAVSELSLTVALAGATEYFWRVRARNTAGSGPWSEIRSFKTIPPPPGTPVLLHPPQYAADIAVPTTVRWSRSPGAANYTLQVSRTPEFASLVVSVNSPDTQSVLTGLDGNTDYYWRVRAIGSEAAGNSPYSSIRRFTTVALPAPAIPELVSPAQFATGISSSSSLTLTWNAASHATSYRVQLSTTPDFVTTIQNDSDLTALSRRVRSLSASTTYYWRVQAVNTSGKSGWSEIHSFSTAAAPVLSVMSQAVVLQKLESGTGTRLRFTLRNPEYVVIRILDMQGREIAIPFASILDVGHHDLALPQQSVGAYLLDFRAGERREVLKFRP